MMVETVGNSLLNTLSIDRHATIEIEILNT